MTDVTAFRLLFMVLMVVMLGIMWRNSLNTSKLLKQGQEDKEAREKALFDLQKTAADLANKTQSALDDANKQQQSLSLKIDKNTEITIKAAEAAEAANGIKKEGS